MCLKIYAMHVNYYIILPKVVYILCKKLNTHITHSWTTFELDDAGTIWHFYWVYISIIASARLVIQSEITYLITFQRIFQ